MKNTRHAKAAEQWAHDWKFATGTSHKTPRTNKLALEHSSYPDVFNLLDIFDQDKTPGTLVPVIHLVIYSLDSDHDTESYDDDVTPIRTPKGKRKPGRKPKDMPAATRIKIEKGKKELLVSVLLLTKIF